MGNHSHLQRIIPTQGLNPDLLHCRQILYHLSNQGSPISPKVIIKQNKDKQLINQQRRCKGIKESLKTVLCSVASVISDSLRPQGPWVHQAPLFMGFSKQEYWSGLHLLLQETFLTQGSKLGLLSLLHCEQILYG